MKIILPAEETTKLCHAAPGDIVRFPRGDAALVESYHSCYIVCLLPSDVKMPATPGGPEGLYRVSAQVRLMDVATGMLKEPPHLSTRCDIYRKAELHLYAPEVPKK